jgi:CRISPR/Cas system-associated endonuclease Cas1
MLPGKRLRAADNFLEGIAYTGCFCFHAGTALWNYFNAVLEGEMTIALHAVGLDPGIGMFHVDVEGRASLALDAIEAVRPYVDYWLVAYLASSAFANRDFTELPDGEVRLTHPLNSHLAHTAML